MTRNRRLLILVHSILAAAAIAYTAWWFVLAAKWREGIAAWAASAPGGWTVTTGAVATAGFPGPIRLALAAPAASSPDGASWQGPPLILTVWPLRPLAPRFAAPGIHRLAWPGREPVEATVGAAEGSVEIAGNALAAGRIELRDLTVLGATAQRIAFEARRIPAGADAAPSIGFELDLDRLTLPLGDGAILTPTIDSAQAAARLKGALPAGSPATVLAAWRDAGGTFEIDSLTVNWPPLVAAGNATLALDRDLQPELAGSFTVRGAGALLDRAEAAGAIDAKAAMLAKLALAAAGKRASDGAVETTLGVTIQDRVLTVGPVPLVELPKVNWPGG